MTAVDHIVLGEQLRQRPNRGGLTGPLLPSNENSADGRDDGVENERNLHRLLPDDGSEGKRMPIEGYAHLSRIGGVSWVPAP